MVATMQTNGIDMAALKRLTSLADANKLLHDVLSKERAIQVELEHRLMHRQDMESDLLSLTAATSDMLQIGHADAVQLTAAMDVTAQRAQQVSRRVRVLDTAQANLVATLNKIDLVITRSDCVSGVQAALDAGNYELAAQHISTYQDLDQDAASLADSDDQGEQAAVLKRARTELVVLVRTKLQQGVEEQDTASVLRFLKLYKPLRMPDEGLRVCTSFLRRCASPSGWRGSSVCSRIQRARSVRPCAAGNAGPSRAVLCAMRTVLADIYMRAPAARLGACLHEKCVV